MIPRLALALLDWLSRQWRFLRSAVAQPAVSGTCPTASFCRRRIRRILQTTIP